MLGGEISTVDLEPSAGYPHIPHRFFVGTLRVIYDLADLGILLLLGGDLGGFRFRIYHLLKLGDHL